MSEKMSAEELEQAREVARKPHRFESAHPTKWSDLTERLLAHIAALQAENDEYAESFDANHSVLCLRKLSTLQAEADALREALVNLTETLCDWEYHRIPRDDAAQIVEKRFGGHIGRAWLHSINTLSPQDRSSEDK